jgi:hypothetical protein
LFDRPNIKGVVGSKIAISSDKNIPTLGASFVKKSEEFS